MTKVYVVGEGEYSDFCITAAFSTHELAEEYCKKLPNQSGSIEELELDHFQNLIRIPYYTAEYANQFYYGDNPRYDEYSELIFPEQIDEYSHKYDVYQNSINDMIYRIYVKSYISAEHAKQMLEKYQYKVGLPGQFGIIESS